MLRISKPGLPVAGALGVLFFAAAAFAAQGSLDQARSQTAGPGAAASPFVQVAMHQGEQTANLPIGTIRLRVIPEVGGRTMNAPIHWQVMTYGRDSSGKRHVVADLTEPTPELVLPAGWYVVHAQLPDKLIKHPVEVTAGRTFKYTLVKN